MRNINHFSQSKFSSLSPVHQLKALDNLVSSLSQSLSPNKNYFELKEHIIHCISWMQSPLPECVSQLSQDLQQEESFDKIYNALVQYQRARGKTFKDYQIQVRKGDGLKVADAEAQRKAQQIILILDNLRSAF
ncbi:MAG: hypothetical protein GX869_08175, partial [Candidatus Cloacimonetes bacterium]|nr:hypothetical protein [Candidatus Cloacimonadota bacterium]